MNREYARLKNLFDSRGMVGMAVFFESFKTVGYASAAALTHTLGGALLEGRRKRIVAGRAFAIGKRRRRGV